MMHAIAGWMARKRFSANGISVAGMALGILAGVALWCTARVPAAARPLWIAGAVLVQLRLLANLLDGMVAVARGTTSRVGELYNEVPDRVSDAAALIGLGCTAGGNVLLGFGAALAAMMTAYVRAVGKGAGAPGEFCGPMAKQQRMFVVTVTALFCAFSPGAWQSADLGCCKAGVSSLALALILLGSLVTTVRRLLRIAARLRGAG